MRLAIMVISVNIDVYALGMDLKKEVLLRHLEVAGYSTGTP